MDMRRRIIVICHASPIKGDFILKDLPGAGRVDELVRCVTASLLISNDVRRCTEIFLEMQSEGETRIVRFRGEVIKNLNPDERTTAMLLKKALMEESFLFEKEVHKGISLVPGDLRELLERTKERCRMVHLVEDGADAFSASVRERLSDAVQAREGIAVMLSDRLDLTPGEAEMVSEITDISLSVGPTSLQAHQVITVFHNLLDRVTVPFPGPI